MYRDTMAPVLGEFEATVDHHLRPDFDTTGNIYAEFLMDEVLRGSFEARATAYQQADYMTVAEKRRAENLPFVDGSDVILVNGAYVPLDLAGMTRQTGRVAVGGGGWRHRSLHVVVHLGGGGWDEMGRAPKR